MTSPNSDFNGQPVDLSMDRAGLEELLATLEKRASAEQDKPAVEAIQLQAELVRGLLG